MAAFKFRLARVLGWYRKQGQLEEDRLRITLGEFSRAEAAIAELQQSRRTVERNIVDAAFVSATDLAALEAYRASSRREELALQNTRTKISKRIEEHRSRLKALRTRIRLLEKLGERRLAEHTTAEERELEELAADAFRAASFHLSNDGRAYDCPAPDERYRS
jgi:chromosome segregation ATPase